MQFEEGVGLLQYGGSSINHIHIEVSNSKRSKGKMTKSLFLSDSCSVHNFVPTNNWYMINETNYSSFE